MPLPRSLLPFRCKGRFGSGKLSGDGAIDTVRMCLSGLFKRARFDPVFAQSMTSIPDVATFSLQYEALEPLITWIGHATFLIRVAGMTILTDPMFTSPSFLFPRLVPPGIPLEALPPIDLVLISHNHFDHLEVSSLKYLAKKYPTMRVCAPVGDHRWLSKSRVGEVSAWTWWESRLMKSRQGSGALTLTFLPSEHWSRRGLMDHNCGLWGSWLIETPGQAIYFAGDTAYGEHFAEIKKQCSVIDTAILPIAPSEPKDRVSDVHVSAEEAGQAFVDLGAHTFIPCHWGTFRFGDEAPTESLRRLKNWWAQRSVEGVLLPLKMGESWRGSLRSVAAMHVRPFVQDVLSVQEESASFQI